MSSNRVLKFTDLIGNTEKIALLRRAAKGPGLSKFTILAGAHGTGKSTSAELLALYGSCESKVNDEPCLVCDACKSNLKELHTTGRSRNVYRKNMAELKAESDVNDFLSTVFTYLQGYTGTYFYIFEELDKLDPEHQAKMLDGIDRLADNVRVIATTNHLRKLYTQLVDRARVYEFDFLKKTELKLLLDRAAEKRGFRKKFDKQTENILIDYARGSARRLVDMVDFLYTQYPTLDELRAFAGLLDPAIFVEVLVSMEGDMMEFMTSMRNLVESASTYRLVYQLKSFMLSYLFALSSNDYSDIPEHYVKRISEVIPLKTFDKILARLEVVDGRHMTEEDFYLMFLRFRSWVQDKPIAESLAQSKAMAEGEKQRAHRAFTESQSLGNASKVKSKTVSSSFFDKH